MANQRKPSHLKSVAGTNRPDRESPTFVDLPLVGELPQAPDWLPNAHAIKEWNRLAPILFANRLLTEAGLSALGMLCSLHGKIVQLYAAGESPNAAMMSQHRALSNDFGLTPVAQGKVKGATKETAPSNPFAKYGQNQA